MLHSFQAYVTGDSFFYKTENMKGVRQRIESQEIKTYEQIPFKPWQL